MALLLRHKLILRRLSFSNIELQTGTWGSIFQRVGGKLPNLPPAGQVARLLL